MKNWNQKDVEFIKSDGGVIALADPFENLIKNGVKPWPPSEIIQKLYESRQKRAFKEEQMGILETYRGYYTDLQSINSEDAITWSAFGTAAHCPDGIRNKFISGLFKFLHITI
jgi:hypothetical protein